ncbi:MAG TPA: Asp-tRNA(Asn)/Glu-tRNA(Gln) amidotransferase subunit GatB, partial [Bacteroidaceae bacterium]|nr:Asp-tRNA(Asn)/Glu-tRNA(Gln) amidotransferase subunit GatB [Bacteroidaceae bacterium]
MVWEIVIGLEVHVQLNTQTKAFCSCKATYGAPPNTQTCPVCLAYPGSLPVLNKEMVRSAVKAGLATHCSLRKVSGFARKNYFYPDLPKGYQISQYDDPICYNGYITIRTETGEKKIGITRIHMEEDAGKSIHSPEGTLVDLNRCGIPLLEIVSEPDIRSPKEAYEYLTTLKQIIRYTGISDCNMEEGSLRCDANLSVMPKGSKTFGTRTELKNMNSFRGVEK